MDDCISRQAAIDALQEVSEHYTEKGREWHPHVNFMVDAIKELPSAQPERKRGKWVDGKCSLCSEHAPFYSMASTYYKSNFCPNCGAEMRM